MEIISMPKVSKLNTQDNDFAVTREVKIKKIQYLHRDGTWKYHPFSLVTNSNGYFSSSETATKLLDSIS